MFLCTEISVFRLLPKEKLTGGKTVAIRSLFQTRRKTEASITQGEGEEGWGLLLIGEPLQFYDV